MGGATVTHECKANSEAEADAEYARVCKHDSEYYGHQEGYSGGWHDTAGFRVVSGVEKNLAAARKRIERENPQKWGAAVGVLYNCYKGKDGAKPPAPSVEKFSKMEVELAEVKSAIKKEEREDEEEFSREFGVRHVMFGTSEQRKKAEEDNKKLIPCKSCGGKIPRSYVHNIDCRICGKRMRPRKTSKTLAAKRKRRETLEKKVKEHPQLFGCLMEGVAPC